MLSALTQQGPTQLHFLQQSPDAGNLLGGSHVAFCAAAASLWSSWPCFKGGLLQLTHIPGQPASCQSLGNPGAWLPHKGTKLLAAAAWAACGLQTDVAAMAACMCQQLCLDGYLSAALGYASFVVTQVTCNDDVGLMLVHTFCQLQWHIYLW